MSINNERDALEWLASWGGKPRPGVLRAAIEGLERSRGIMVNAPARYSAETVANIEAALRVLRAA